MGLREQVLADPACAVAYATKDCDELARIGSIGRTRTVLVAIADVQAKLQSSGAWWPIKAIAADTAHPANGAAVAVTDVAHARYANVDMSIPLVAQMFSALVFAGALAQEVMDEIMGMSILPAPYTQREVAIELYHDDGTPK